MSTDQYPCVFKVDLDKPAEHQPFHNRWHPEIPSVATIQCGSVYTLETIEWTGGQIGNTDDAKDVKTVDLSRIHYLSGPFEIEGAEVDDILVVELIDIQPLKRQPFCYTGVFAKENGGGFLSSFYPEAAKIVYDIDENNIATSRHLPHVKFDGLIHPGIVGVAPSAEQLKEINERELELKRTAKNTEDVSAIGPLVKGAHAGQAKGELFERIAREGLRTIPGRPENAGNCDVKNITAGSRTYLRVNVPGAKLSLGDAHFSMSDGESSFCGAGEMSSIITIRTSLIKNGVDRMKITNPIFLPGKLQKEYPLNRYLTFEGFSVDETGEQKYLCANTAFKQACIKAIEYLRKYGYNDYQIYMFLSSAPLEAHIASIVDVPNACCTLGIPMDIFDFDISPEAEPVKLDMGNCAFVTGADHEVTFDFDKLLKKTKLKNK
ncbi:hypothetical protein KGF54_003504 [Candida jiufengensis]|uniref:uncharacterized protein n=1 Tax=Candida jiufengensis TaxID=497108 RepID=UPI002224B4B1|nr:uncharacterized protein KGF54_003504 [Candida jiufengensis]KAI5952637.1 hypothetical protein KGF54_003504 [Candida jiufengensis]